VTSAYDLRKKKYRHYHLLWFQALFLPFQQTAFGFEQMQVTPFVFEIHDYEHVPVSVENSPLTAISTVNTEMEDFNLNISFPVIKEINKPPVRSLRNKRQKTIKSIHNCPPSFEQQQEGSTEETKSQRKIPEENSSSLNYKTTKSNQRYKISDEEEEQQDDLNLRIPKDLSNSFTL